MDRELKQIMEKGIDAVNKLSDGIQKLIEEPMVEIESSPPQCPHCRTINPKILIKENDDVQGRLSEFVLVATCMNCDNQIYGIAMGWSVLGDKEGAIKSAELMAERVLGNG